MVDISTLSELLRQVAYGQGGGFEEPTTDKLNRMFAGIRQSGLDIAAMKNQAVERALKKKQMQLAENKDTRETAETVSKLTPITESLITPRVRAKIGEAESAPIPPEDLISGRLDTRQRGIDEAQRIAISGQKKYGTMTPEQYAHIKESGGSGNSINISSDLRKEFINRPEVKDFILVRTNVNAMDSMLNSAKEGNWSNLSTLDQALITMYNKLTDPTSVVRESEYNRTPENIPTVNRIVGAIEKVNSGGAGLTLEDREALVLGAKIISTERGKQYKETRDNYTILSNKYGIDPSLVTGTLSEFKEYPKEENPDNLTDEQATNIVQRAIVDPNYGLTQQERYAIERKRAQGVSDRQLAEVINKWRPTRRQ